MKEPAIVMHRALWYIVFVCYQNDVCKKYIGSVYVGVYGGLVEAV